MSTFATNYSQIEDLIDLEPLSIDTVVAALKHRFVKLQTNYTFLSDRIISLNPLVCEKKSAVIYSAKTVDSYLEDDSNNAGNSSLPPHIYTIANLVLKNVQNNCNGCESQNIFFLGESGSGKSEAARILLQFMILASKSKSDETISLKEKLIQTGILLEAFGNAKTILNDNATRYGKFFDIEFDFKGDPVGGHLTHFHLEKFRISRNLCGERNFHIFYQLLAGADTYLIKQLKLHRNWRKYAILTNSFDCGKFNSIAGLINNHNRSSNRIAVAAAVAAAAAAATTSDGCGGGDELGECIHDINYDHNPNDNLDKKHFTYTKNALAILGFKAEEILEIFQVIAIILKLSNITFESYSRIDNTEACKIINDFEIHEISELLQTDSKILSTMLTRKLILSDTQQTVNFDLRECESNKLRDNLCRNLYAKLFTWIIGRINVHIKAKNCSRHSLIGLFDMYGFENTHENFFEQLLINYCNEKTINLLQKRYFIDNQEEYFKEDINWLPIDFHNNKSVCDLFEKENGCSSCGVAVSGADADADADADAGAGASIGGLFLIFDNYEYTNTLTNCLLTISKIVNKHKNSSMTAVVNSDRCQSYRSKFHFSPIDDSFKICHFAGQVTYSKVSKFCEKNHDFLSAFVLSVMYRCQHPLMKSLFPEGSACATISRKFITLSDQCRLAMKSVSKIIAVRKLHYIFCVKPNDSQKARCFDNFVVQRQLCSFNLIPLAKLCRAGFQSSLPYKMFLHRYKLVSKFTWPKWLAGHMIEAILLLINDLGLPKSDFVFGKSKLFIRSPKIINKLESIRKIRINQLAILIQKTWKGYLCRKRFLKLKNSQVVIALAWRSWKELKHGIPFKGRKHLWCLYYFANKEYHIIKKRKQIEWATRTIQKCYLQWKKKQYLLRLPYLLTIDHRSPTCNDWPVSSNPRHKELCILLKQLHHKIRCYNYRMRIDQITKNRMREKVTASYLFCDKKRLYKHTISHPFLGDYVRLRQNNQWKKQSIETNDQYIVFADIVNKIARSNGKFVPVLLVISTNALLVLDHRTLQIKYRIAATDIYRLSLSPFSDNITIVHIKASNLSRKKGDFVFQSGHIIEIVTKLYLVIKNAVLKAPEINIRSQIEANFGQQTILIAFVDNNSFEKPSNSFRIYRRANQMEIYLK